MKSAYWKNIFRTIKKSLGRYLAILSIIALGVGFFAGLTSAKPAMMKTAQEYLKEQKLYDFRLLSTWGFSEKEIAKIGQLEGMGAAVGALSEDFIYVNEQGEENVLKAHSITADVNLLDIVAGSLPKKDNECVLDAHHFKEDMIGKKIIISEQNEQNTRDSFTYSSYQVTGLVNSPAYMNMERGTATIGNGKVSGFIYIPPEGFVYDYYEEVYVTGQEIPKSFTDAYEAYMDTTGVKLEDEAAGVTEARYQSQQKEAKQEIADAQKELDSKVSKAKQELLDAKAKLADGEQQLAEGQNEIATAKDTLAAEEQKLIDGETSLAAGVTQYDSGLKQYQENYNTYLDSLSKLEENRAAYDASKSSLDSYVQPEVDKITRGQLIGGYLSQSGQFEPASWSSYLLELANNDQISQETMQSLVFTAETTEQSPAYQSTIGMITRFETVNGFEQGLQELGQAKVQLDAAKEQLDRSAAQIAVNQNQLAAGRTQLEQEKTKLLAAEQELTKRKQELQTGLLEYEDGMEKLEQERKDGHSKIDDAKKALSDMEKPKLYVLDRGTNVGYACYENDVGVVEGIAKVFPIFFFLIAALVCSTTMTRMVDDERTQIGTLRALGYQRSAIFAKYMIYSGSAAGLGCLVGFYLGIWLFPNAIWTAYGILYGFADIAYVNDFLLLALSLLVSLLCSVGSAFFACRHELNHAPAELIRPKAPAAGKRILLERLPFVWKRLKFLYKVTARNVFRFKKRMIMMILGIAGCMALVVTGFGVKDSVANVVNSQYDQILLYDITISYSKAVTEKTTAAIQKRFGSELKNSAVLLQTAVDAPYEGGTKSVILMAAEPGALEECVSFHQNGKKVPAPGDGEVIIDERLARALAVKEGDEISFRVGDVDKKPLKIAGIFENYTSYYAYVSDKTYETFFQEAYEPDTIYFTLKDGADEYKIASYLANMKNAANVGIVSEMRSRVLGTMNQMNYVIMLVIGCAGVLALIVLFNLGNINISERVREIATLKVLGFYPRETGAYVFRENMVLSLIGMAAGIPLGVLFHRFVMGQIEVDMVSFDITILPQSYLYSILIVVGFTVFVDLLMRRKIDKINMAESLKSIE